MTTVLHNTGHPRARRLTHLGCDTLGGSEESGKLGIPGLNVAHLLDDLSHHAHGSPVVASGAKHDHVLLRLARVVAGIPMLMGKAEGEWKTWRTSEGRHGHPRGRC